MKKPTASKLGREPPDDGADPLTAELRQIVEDRPLPRPRADSTRAVLEAARVRIKPEHPMRWRWALAAAAMLLAALIGADQLLKPSRNDSGSNPLVTAAPQRFDPEATPKPRLPALTIDWSTGMEEVDRRLEFARGHAAGGRSSRAKRSGIAHSWSGDSRLGRMERRLDRLRADTRREIDRAEQPTPVGPDEDQSSILKTNILHEHMEA